MDFWLLAHIAYASFKSTNLSGYESLTFSLSFYYLLCQLSCSKTFKHIYSTWTIKIFWSNSLSQYPPFYYSVYYEIFTCYRWAPTPFFNSTINYFFSPSSCPTLKEVKVYLNNWSKVNTRILLRLGLKIQAYPIRWSEQQWSRKNSTRYLILKSLVYILNGILVFPFMYS